MEGSFNFSTPPKITHYTIQYAALSANQWGIVHAWSYCCTIYLVYTVALRFGIATTKQVLLQTWAANKEYRMRINKVSPSWI